MRIKLFKDNFSVFCNGERMADLEEKFCSRGALQSKETLIAIRLAEALRTDEVDKFLDIYDSIPTSTNTKRVHEIKEMARQLAALPKKQFELYRSKKILSSDHAFLPSGSGQVLKDKLGTNFISGTAFYEVNTVQKVSSANQTVENSDAAIPNDAEVNPKPAGNKKKRKSKKGKTPISSNSGNSSKEGTADQTGETVDLKHKLFSGGPLCVSMNTNLVADISTGTELKSQRDIEASKVDLHVGRSTREDNITPNELTEDIKEVDSGLGSYASPLLPREPPFGFPPSSQKLLESALGLLPSVTCDKDNSFDAVGKSENHLRLSKDVYKEAERTSSFVLQSSETDKTLQKLGKSEDDSRRQEIEDDPISDVSDTKEICKEGDSVDGDVSSSSAVEDEGGWQSQTKRSHRKKKKELIAARAGREKNHIDRFPRKDNNHRQQSDNQARKNHYHKKAFDNKKNHNGKFAGTKVQDTQDETDNVLAKSSSLVCSTNVQAQAEIDKEIKSKPSKGLLASDGKLATQNEVTVPKQLSYRDALVKSKTKVEPVYSSDSGVDANSVSSCESSNVQPEAQKDLFNKQQCVDYLRNAWKKVMSDTKQGLVIYFSVDADPVKCEQQRKKRVVANKGSTSRPR